MILILKEESALDSISNYANRLHEMRIRLLS